MRARNLPSDVTASQFDILTITAHEQKGCYRYLGMTWSLLQLLSVPGSQNRNIRAAQ